MKLNKIAVAVGVGATLVAGSAMAALPLAMSTAVAGFQTDAQAVFDVVFPVVASVIGLTVGIKLFKRFSSKV